MLALKEQAPSSLLCSLVIKALLSSETSLHKIFQTDGDELATITSMTLHVIDFQLN